MDQIKEFIERIPLDIIISFNNHLITDEIFEILIKDKNLNLNDWRYKRIQELNLTTNITINLIPDETIGSILKHGKLTKQYILDNKDIIKVENIIKYTRYSREELKTLFYDCDLINYDIDNISLIIQKLKLSKEEINKLIYKYQDIFIKILESYKYDIEPADYNLLQNIDVNFKKNSLEIYNTPLNENIIGYNKILINLIEDKKKSYQ